MKHLGVALTVLLTGMPFLLGQVMTLAQEISGPESLGSGGKFYYLDSTSDEQDWYEGCSGVESGHGPPAHIVYKIQSTDLTTTVKLKGCFQSCETGKIFCEAISVE